MDHGESEVTLDHIPSITSYALWHRSAISHEKISEVRELEKDSSDELPELFGQDRPWQTQHLSESGHVQVKCPYFVFNGINTLNVLPMPGSLSTSTLP
jgi:hypothetical protein